MSRFGDSLGSTAQRNRGYRLVDLDSRQVAWALLPERAKRQTGGRARVPNLR